MSTQLDVYKYYAAHPETSAKDALVTILKDYSSSIPSPILLEMAEFILSEWEAIQTNKQEWVLA